MRSAAKEVGLSVLSALAILGCDASQGEDGNNHAVEDEPSIARLVGEAVHADGNRIRFYQAGDGSFALTQVALIGKPPLELPQDLDMPALFKHIAPNAPVPESLIEAQRNYKYAQENGLLGKNWLPSGRESAKPTVDPHVDSLQQAAWRGEEEQLDPEWFRDTFCRPFGAQWCWTRKVNNYTFSHGRFWPLTFTTAFSTHGGYTEAAWHTCAVGLFCRSRMERGWVPAGYYQTFVSHRSGIQYRMDYKISTQGMWHLAVREN